VVFTPVAREPVNNKGCGPFPKTLDTHGYSVRLKSARSPHRTVVPRRKRFIFCSRIRPLFSVDVPSERGRCARLNKMLIFLIVVVCGQRLGVGGV